MENTINPVAPLDGTRWQDIQANMGLRNYPLFGVPITDILKQIEVNEKRKTRTQPKK